MATTFTKQASYGMPVGTGNNPQVRYNENFPRMDQAGGWMKLEIATGHGGTEGQWYTYDSSGKAIKADSADQTKCKFVFILTETKAAGEDALFLKLGWWEKTGWALSLGSTYYLKDDGTGDMQTTPPTGGSCVVLLGFALTTELFHIGAPRPGEAFSTELVDMDIHNNSGGAVNRGQAVYISGWDAVSELPTIAKAKSDAVGTMPAAGIIKSTVADGSSDKIVLFGLWGGIDTSSWAAGDILFVDATTAGTLTNVEPTGNEIQVVAQVMRSHATLGEIKVMCATRQDQAGGGGGAVFWDAMVDPAGSADYTTAAAACAGEAANALIAFMPGATTEVAAVTMKDGQVLFCPSRPAGAAGDYPVTIGMGSNIFTPANGTTVRGINIQFEGQGTTAYLGQLNDSCSFIDCRFQHTGTTQGRLFDVRGNHTLFDNCIVDGNGYLVFGFIVHSSYVVFRNLQMLNMALTDYSGGEGIRFDGANNCIVDGLYFEETGAGTHTSPVINEAGVGGPEGNFYTNLRIFDNSTTGNKLTAVYLSYDGSAVDNVYIEKGQYGIYLSAAKNARVDNYQIKSCTSHGICVMANSNNAKIGQGVIDTCGTSGSTTTGGIKQASDDVVVQGLSVINTPGVARDFELWGNDCIYTNCISTGAIQLQASDCLFANSKLATVTVWYSPRNHFSECKITGTITLTGSTFTLFDRTYEPSGDTDPTVNEDKADGFRVGDHWVNSTGNKVFVCESNASGAAVWRQVYPSSGAPAAHAASHKNGGSDEILLNEFGEPTALVNFNDQRLSNLGLLHFNSRAVTISGGLFAYNADASVYLVSGEGAAADDLNGINNVPGNALVILAYAGETITIKNLAAGGGVEFKTRSGGDIVINGSEDAYMFMNIGGELVQMG